MLIRLWSFVGYTLVLLLEYVVVAHGDGDKK